MWYSNNAIIPGLQFLWKSITSRISRAEIETMPSDVLVGAVRSQDLPQIINLLENNKENLSNHTKCLALTEAITCFDDPHRHITTKLHDKRKSIVYLLLDNDCNLETVPDKWYYLLYLGVYHNLSRVTDHLLSTLKIVDKQKGILIQAVESLHFRVIHLLIRNKADLNEPNRFGVVPLQHAVMLENRELALILLKYGATTKHHPEIFFSAIRKRRMDIVELILQLDENLLINSEEGVARKRALHILLETRGIVGWKVAMVVKMLEKGADVDHQTSMGTTALHLACYCEADEAECLVQVLLAAKADVNLQNDVGISALHEAARIGSVKICSMLLKAGAKVNAAAMSKPQTALEKACCGGHSKCVELLLNNGAILYSVGNTFSSLISTVQFRILLIEVDDGTSELGFMVDPNAINFDLRSYERILSIIEKHVTKLAVAGFKLHSTDLEFVKDLDNKTFITECMNELDRLKAPYFKDLTLHDVLTWETKKLYKHVRRAEAVPTLVGKYKTLYPIYGRIIKSRLMNIARKVSGARKADALQKKISCLISEGAQ